MANRDDHPSPSPQLWYNIDDDEDSEYIQPARSRSTTRRRRPWSGANRTGPGPAQMSEEEREKHLQEFAEKFLKSDESIGMDMTVAEVRAACAEVFGVQDSDQSNNLEELPLEPPPRQPAEDELMEDVAKLIATGSSVKPVVTGAFRNPSPPRTTPVPDFQFIPPPPPRRTPNRPRVTPPATQPATIAAQPARQQSRGPAPCRPRDEPDNHKTAERRVTEWLHSTDQPAGKPPLKKGASKSSSRESHESRAQSGKRTLVAASNSTAPPAQRRRERDASKSPVRDKSPGVYRKDMLRGQVNQPPLPIIDAFACKDLAVLLKRLGQQFHDTQWTTDMNQPHDQLQLVGIINQIGVPRLYLKEGEYDQLTADKDHPLADITRREFDEEQAVLPSHFVIGHAFGAFPQYAAMVSQKTREVLSVIPPTTKFYSALRFGGIGPTGYDLRGSNSEYRAMLKIQQQALVRLGRAARRGGRPLVVLINYDRERANFDPHADAIDQLQRLAQLDAQHPIHLASYDGTVGDLIKWLDAFPNTVIGLGLHHLATQALTIETAGDGRQLGPADTKTLRNAEAFRTFFQRVPLRNVVIQSLCPFPVDNSPGQHHSPPHLFRFGAIFERLIRVPGAGRALYAYSAENARRTYNLSPELLKNLATADDSRPERLNLRPFIECMQALYAPAAAVPRAGPKDQDERRRFSIAESSPMSGVEEGKAPAQPKPRSQSARGRQSPSPTKTKDDRGRSSDKHQKQKKGSKTGPLSVAEPAQSNSKAASQADKDNKRNSSKPGPLSGEESAKHHAHRDRSPPRSPPKNSTRRIVVLTPSPEPKADILYVLKDAEPEEIELKYDDDWKPSLRSQVVVPERSRSAFTGGLRITVPRTSSSTFKEPRLPNRPDVRPEELGPRNPRTASQPPLRRAPVLQRIAFTIPKPFTAKDSLKEFQQRRSGDSEPDPLLMPEPVLQEVVPPPASTRELLDLADPYFIHERDREAGTKSTRVNIGRLAPEEVPRAQRSAIRVTTGRNHPWDPIRLCLRTDELDHFHKTLEEANLIGKKERWLKSGGIKKNALFKEFLDEVMDLIVRSFGQMILVKFGARLRYDDPSAIDVLRFIHEVLTARNLDTDLPRILASYHQRIVRRGYLHPWPNYNDFHRAAEHWVCYCEDAYFFLFHRLSGTATWETGWLQTNVLPLAARQLVLNEMIGKAQEHFDELRHQLYVQYGRQHLEANDRHAFRWIRFDESLAGRIPTKAEDVIRQPTVCFVDKFTEATFGDNLRPDVVMITIPDGGAAQIYFFIARFYLAGTVERVVLWFGRQFLLDHHREYYDLMAVLGHHLAVFFNAVQQFIVLPVYMQDRLHLWSQGPLALFLQRADVVPRAHVVLHHHDLHYWFGDVKKLNQPLPDFMDSSGRLLTEEAIEARKVRLTEVHHLDLWRSLKAGRAKPQRQKTTTKAVARVPGPLSYSPPSAAHHQKGKGVSGPLSDAPSTSSAPPPSSSTKEELLKSLGLDSIAAYVAQQIRAQLTSQMDARLSAVERIVAANEPQDAEMEDDSDALSETTPYKDHGSKK